MGVDGSNRWARQHQDRDIGRLVKKDSKVYRNMDMMELDDKASFEGTYGCWDFHRVNT